MTSLRRSAVGLLSLFVIAAAGCTPPLPKSQVTLDTLVAEYNANAATVPMLAAYADIEFTAYHETTGLGLPLWSSPNGLLRMKKGPDPLGAHDMVLIGREVSKQVLRVGTSRKDNAYYMWTLIPETKAMWGRLKLAGAPGIKLLPIDPTGLQAVLGICQLPADQSGMPAVTLQMDTTPGRYAYVLGYVSRQPVSNKFVLQREFRFGWDEKRSDWLAKCLWGSRRPRRIEEINFFDDRGRKMMSAAVSDYKPVDVSALDNPPQTPPIMPTDIRITWFNDRKRKTASVRLRLSQMTAEEIWDTEICEFLKNVPNDIPPEKVIQVDKNIPLTREGDDK
ncbi:MAG: hypothetical protein ISS69_17625 [Phycisphaerae bacterium]|nr:hypothetical protein [Phycisphaerae bacterium]